MVQDYAFISGMKSLNGYFDINTFQKNLTSFYS